MHVKELIAKFQNYFLEQNLSDIRIFFSPGRVNLIGEHIDYNGGYVFPASLSIGTYLLVQKRTDNKLIFVSENFPGKSYERSVENLYFNEADGWSNYPKGVFDAFKTFTNVELTGMNLYFWGNIPNGSGLSSSASIELVTATMLNEVYEQHIDKVELVKLAQKVENHYIGVNCGIMDQFAIGMGKKECAIILDCASLEFDYVPLELKTTKIVIMNTNKKRMLADSKYNERRSECEKALAIFQTKLDIQNLCDMNLDLFDINVSLLEGHDVLTQRARHVVSENERTKEAVSALRNGDLEHFGKLLNASHKSLKEDYEVTGVELDTLAETAQLQAGCLGARMTGAGFGGCALAIVEEVEIESFIAAVGVIYKNKTGVEASFYVVETGSGSTELFGR
ncbi:MAG: galactokinase [Fusobacteria bacterium]|nr:galactokinase [Fusobacteriota bacterium]